MHANSLLLSRRQAWTRFWSMPSVWMSNWPGSMPWPWLRPRLSHPVHHQWMMRAWQRHHSHFTSLFFASLSWMQVTIAKSKHPDSFGRSKAYEGFIIFQIDAAAKCRISHLCVFSGHWCGTKTTQARQGLLMPFIKVKYKRKLNPCHPSKFAGTQECQKEANHGGPSWWGQGQRETSQPS